MLWVRVPPEQLIFLRKKSSSGVVELCCVSLCIFGRCLEVCLSCILFVEQLSSVQPSLGECAVTVLQ